MSRNTGAALVGVVLALAVAGCAGRLARDSHGVKKSMTLQEAEAILGPGKENRRQDFFTGPASGPGSHTPVGSSDW